MMKTMIPSMTKSNRPWYREPIMWLVIAFQLTAVIVGFVSLALAIRSDDGMVEDDYYKQGMAINRMLDRDKAAAAENLTGTVELDTAQHELRVRLTARQAQALPDNIQIKLMHATRAGFDHSLVLPRHADGTYRAPLPEFVPGHWDVQLTAQDWRLTGSLFMPGDNRLVMRPTIP
jgi:hypothetical protein